MSILSPKKGTKKQIDFINKKVDKGVLRNLLSDIYSEHGAAKTATLANNLKDLGFKYATHAGITISIQDLHVPEGKKQLLTEAENDIEKSTQRFHKGEITEVERYTKVIDTWSETTEKLTRMVVDNLDRMNPVYMMAFSGARGNISQVRQLIGMRGLMADAQGQIIDLPIKSNFREGLSVTEYIISSYGARKGLVDTALKTADSGYLTRRLVDVAQDVIIQELDCGTKNGVMMRAIQEGETEMVSLEERLISRTAAVNVVNEDGEILATAGEVITPEAARKIIEGGITEVLVRSGLTCECHFGICQKCYGWSLTTNHPVDIGEAIGIMAAQSIGEPGTQLTMRTFHTGGAFSGSLNREALHAKNEGKVVKSLNTRDFRTRHGDIVQAVTKDSTLEIKKKDGKSDKYNLPHGAIVYALEEGQSVKAGEVIAEFEGGRSDSRRLTEKASKDINTDIGGEVFFEGFDADEKRDRQGNISRTSNKSGTIWVLGGDIYNLPAGSKHLIKDGQDVKSGDVIAETHVSSEHGGEVRIPEDLKTENLKSGKKTIKKIVNGKELTIIIASISPDNAELEQTKKEQLWKTGKGKTGEQYIIKSPQGTTVENGSIIAELVDESMTLPTSGEIRYEDLEIDEQRIITKPGKIYFIPEEIHQVSKDSSLKSPDIQSGQHVKAGTEIVKDVVARTSGIVEIVEENDIIREVIIRPGELHRVNDVSTINVVDGTVVDKGTEIAPKIKAKERCMVTINFQMEEPDEDMDEDDMDDTSEFEYAEVLLRPVQEFEVAPTNVKIKFNSTEKEHISIVPVTQLHFNDGDKCRHIEGAPLLRTSLVLQMNGYLSRLKGVVEIQEGETKKDPSNLKIVVLENLTVRRESTTDISLSQASTQTELLVEDGQIIDKKAPVVKTQVLAKTAGVVSLGNADGTKDIRRVLLVTKEHELNVPVSGKASVKKGQYIKAEQSLGGKTESPTSGQIVDVNAKGVSIRIGHPFLISAGAQLHIDNRALIQRGDLVGTLVFERQKTGDIVQGLPRVEELLEGRKPKESAVVSPYDATAEVSFEEDAPKVCLVSENGREEIAIPLGSNILVENKAPVKAGQPLTDGAINPHDIMEINGVEAVRKYLVDEVQRVYRSQGVEIADKHIEIIVRQMTKKVRVDESGDSIILPGELCESKLIEEVNKKLKEKKSKNFVISHPVLLGITKASLNTESFISAASFQETTRVLTEAAVEGKQDYLRGLKENVIIGRLIPAGTGFPKFKDERGDMIDDQAQGAKSTARKPSAILEEIESMFGSPEISKETMGNMFIDDGSLGEELIDDRAEALGNGHVEELADDDE